MPEIFVYKSGNWIINYLIYLCWNNKCVFMIIEWKFVVSCFFFSKFWSSKHSCYALCSCSVSFLHIPCLVYRYVSRFYLFQFYKRNRSEVPRVFFYHTKTCYITVVQWKCLTQLEINSVHITTKRKVWQSSKIINV